MLWYRLCLLGLLLLAPVPVTAQQPFYADDADVSPRDWLNNPEK